MSQIHEQRSALDAFTKLKSNIENIINRLQGACEDHFAINPADLNWGDVEFLADIDKKLQYINDSIFKEGEYAND